MFLEIVHEFIKLLIMVTPYFVMGLLVGVLLELYIPESLINKLLKNRFSLFFSALFAALIPGCACATIPMAEGLKKQGVSTAAIATFIFASPILGLHTFIMTYGLIGADFAWARLGFALSVSILAGSFVYILFPKLNIKVSEKKSCCISHTPSFINSFKNIVKKLSGYYLLGLFIAAVMTALLPPNFLEELSFQGIYSYIVASFIGIPVYICEGEEIPLTIALLNLGLNKGAAFSFMVGSVGTCIPTMLMAQKIVGKKVIGVYLLIWLIAAPMAGYLFTLI